MVKKGAKNRVDEYDVCRLDSENTSNSQRFAFEPFWEEERIKPE